jgi:hypothetical protein
LGFDSYKESGVEFMLSSTFSGVKRRLFLQLRVLDNAIADGEDYPNGYVHFQQR